MLCDPHVARDANAVARLLIDRDERLVIVMVDVGEVLQLALRQAHHGREEAHVARLRAQALKTLCQSVAVGCLEGADVNTPPLPELNRGNHR